MPPSDAILPALDRPRWDRLPEYARLLTARHEAHGDTFRRMVADVPLAKDADVLDVAIGDGFFTALFAARAVRGRVVGLDVDPAFLGLADDAYVDRRRGHLAAGDAYALPFADGSFDLVWCAHSLRSLPDAVGAVREWARVLRPGGRVVLLENDRLHGAVLPWPPEVELDLYRAERRAKADEDRSPGGLHAGRRLARVFREAGLEPAGRTTYATDLTAPLDAADRAFLDAYFEDLAASTRDHAEDWPEAARWVTPEGDRYLPAAADFEAAFLDVVAVGRKPG